MTKKKEEKQKRSCLYRKWPLRFFPLEIFEGIKRQQLYSPGSLMVLLIIISPIAIWLSYSPDSVKDPLIAVAKFNAFTAITLLSLNFILSTRSKVLEVLFNGLDRMYRVHKVVGRASLFFIIVHPMFLIISRFSDTDLVISYILPTGGLDVATGVISVYIFLLLLALTVAVRLPYHYWHNSHKLLGIVLILAGFHAVAAGSDIARYPILRLWIIFLVSAGTISWLYMLIFYKLFGPRYNVEISNIDHMKDITEIHFKRPGNFHYQPGQYIFIRFPRFEGYKELFPFSISNDPCQPTVRISIRRLGDYTGSKVPLLRKGDKAIVMGPYGKFGKRYLEHKKDMIWVAGGIGITPFLSLAKHESLFPTGRRIHLIWVIRGFKDAFHDSELFVEAKRNEKFDYLHWFSGQKGRITTEDIIEMIGGKEEVQRRLIFMCGPPSMMENISKGLHKMGVPYRNIIYEDFNMLD